ncbi:hypothetical protein X801_00826, partial [Opisthorchis viverrini]
MLVFRGACSQEEAVGPPVWNEGNLCIIWRKRKSRRASERATKRMDERMDAQMEKHLRGQGYLRLN